MKDLGIIFDYQIICDESNNTKKTIDNNELHVKYGVKSNKDAPDFQVVEISLGATGSSFEEALGD